jgi:hypothetical protein
VLIEAIKEQQTMINNLKQEIEELKKQWLLMNFPKT